MLSYDLWQNPPVLVPRRGNNGDNNNAFIRRVKSNNGMLSRARRHVLIESVDRIFPKFLFV